MSISLQTADQIFNMALTLISMTVFRKIDQKNPTFLFYIRAAFITGQMLNFLLLYIITRRIQSKKDPRIVKVKKTKSFFDNTGDDDEDAEIEMTYSEYDAAECSRLLKNSAFQFIVLSIGHYKWKINQPLLSQSLTPIKCLFLSPIFMWYLRGKNVKRPFELNELGENVEDEKVVVEKKKKED